VVADSFKHILIERARAGVKVMLLLDAFGAGPLTDAYLDSLRAASVRVAMFRPVKLFTLHKAQNRSHVRAIIIDESVGYTGGFGLADYWLGDGHHEEQWRDSNVRFTGPSVLQLQGAFAVAWTEATGELLTGRFLFGGGAKADSGATQVAGLMHHAPSLGSTQAERFLALSIAGAKQRLYITNSYFVPDDDQIRMLAQAVKRGVDVRVLTAGPNTDVKTVRHASHASYQALLEAGVRLFEFQPAMLHAKTIVVDGVWSTVGTMNFDNRSIAFNDESNLLIHDAGFGRLLEAQFLDDLRYSNEFKLELFRKRSILSRIMDGAAAQMSKWL
jgi:cardiolipin synthase